jgi:hypothetical protein
MTPAQDTKQKCAPGFETVELYNVYNVTIKLRDQLRGGQPKNPDLLKGWIAATTEHDDATTTKQEQEAREALLEPTEEKSWNGFPADEKKGLFIWSRQIKAMFKECASMRRIFIQKVGSKQILQHGFEIKGPDADDRVFLGKMEPAGCHEGPIHVQTAQGPRTAIKRVDYVEHVTINFAVWVLITDPKEKRHVGEEEVRAMLVLAQENGLGADRSQGHGKFDVIEFTKVR